MTDCSSVRSADLPDPDLSNRLLDSIFRIAKVINTKKIDYHAQMAEILEIILDYLDVEQGSIMVVEKKKNLRVQAASRPGLVGHRQPLDDNSVASWVARKAAPLFIPDISKDPRFEGRGGDVYKQNSLLSVPILHQGRAIGVINVTDRAGGKQLLKEDTTCLLDFSSLILWLVVQQGLNEELKKQRNTLRQRNQELRRQEALRAELTKTMIHDLKGPLSEVVANLDILSYSVSDENREFLEAAQIACDKTVRMVSNLVTVDKIEDGKIKLLKEEVSPLQLLEESVSGIRGLARIKDVKLVFEVPDEELPPIRLDRTMILRVLQNLLTNGLGYSSPGTTITVGCRRVPRRKRLEFYVRDQGPGIPAEKQETIFEKYARVSHQQDSLVGTGLGLYFCRLAVEVHRGEIGIESRLGKGSRFYFHLPL